MEKKNQLNNHNEIQRQYYEKRSFEENHRLQASLDSVESPYLLSHLEKVIRYGLFNKTDKILDVGCGMGKYTIPLAQRGYNIEGMDLCQTLLDGLKAKSQNMKQINTYCFDLHHPIEELKGQYDVIFGGFMLHHLLDLTASFNAINQLLNKHGKVVFIDVNPLCPLYYLQITLSTNMRWRAEKGIFNLTQKNLTMELDKTGFCNIQFQKFGIEPPFIRNSKIGGGIDKLFSKLHCLKKLSAFQIIVAEKIN